MSTPAHDCEFAVVWRGQHWRLASLSWHIKSGVDLDGPERILFDSFGVREVRAPLSDLYFCNTLPR